MPFCFRLINNRNVILPVRSVFPFVFAFGIIAVIPPALLYEIFCRFELFFFTGDAIEFYESHFNDLVARSYVTLSRTKDGANKVRILQSNIE